MPPFDLPKHNAIHLQNAVRLLRFRNIHLCDPNLKSFLPHGQSIASQKTHGLLFQRFRKNILKQQCLWLSVNKNLELLHFFVQKQQPLLNS